MLIGIEAMFTIPSLCWKVTTMEVYCYGEYCRWRRCGPFPAQRYAGPFHLSCLFPLKTGQTNYFLSQKMCNVLKRIQIQFSELFEFFRTLKCSFSFFWDIFRQIIFAKIFFSSKLVAFLHVQ